jgi:hypothetical protein
MGARHELNRIHALGSVGLAAIAGIFASSWVIFVLVLAALIAISLFTGEIRPRRQR